MLIGRVEHDPKKGLQTQLPESTINLLDKYRELYRVTFGEKVSTSDLVDLMLRHVMERDRQFKRFLKEEQRKEKLEAQKPDQDKEAHTSGPQDGDGNAEGASDVEGSEEEHPAQDNQGMGR